MKQLSLKEAKRLSILKWEANVAAGVHSVKFYVCGFCRRYRALPCEMCEVAIADMPCSDPDSKYSKWENNRTAENAQAILDLIKSIPDEE